MSKLSINEVPLFKSLSPDDVILLGKTLKEVVFPANTILIRENERGQSLYIILEGQTEVYKTMGSGDKHLLATQQPGDIIGEMSLINRDSLRTASVRTVTSVTLLEMSHIDFDALLKRSPSLAIDIMRELSLRLKKSDNDTIQYLQQAFDETLEAWGIAVDLRDKETEEHNKRVTQISYELGKYLHLTEEDLVNLRRGAMLHDIGKMGIPDGILLKPGSLTEEERAIMQKHTTYARDMLLKIKFLEHAIDVPYYHHEKWNGSGYPTGKKGEEIPFSARIYAIVDVWDALVVDRHYRKRMKVDDVLEYIQSLSGVHFDPHVVDAFIALYQQKPGFFAGLYQKEWENPEKTTAKES